MQRVVETYGWGDGPTRCVAGILCVVLVADPVEFALAAPLLLATPADTRGRELLPIVLWLAAGVVTGGAIGWVIATVVASITAAVGAIFGLAVGGGSAVAVRLIAGDQEEDQSEGVTVDMSDEEAATSPQPVDLFERHPDPILYYEDTGEGPVVRAANDAFGETFGVTPAAVEAAALEDAAMVSSRSGDLRDAASDGRAFDDVLDCDVPDGTRSFRVRVVAVTAGTTTRGYVLYAPAPEQHD